MFCNILVRAGFQCVYHEFNLWNVLIRVGNWRVLFHFMHELKITLLNV